MRHALALTLILAATAPPDAPAPIRGFTAARAAWQREYERRFLELPTPEECGAILRELTRTPHLAGTAGNARVADFLAAEYRKAGFTVETPTYDVLLSYPRSARIELLDAAGASGEGRIPLGRGEEPIAADPDTAIPEAAMPWNAYAPSGEVTGDVVYVNRGSPEDYDRLEKLGVRIRGRIALARYFGGYRGGKSLEAEKRGALALLVYSDPADDGAAKGPVYPDGPWGNDSHFQRGADVYDFKIPGDPLTPGWPSRTGMRRIAQKDSPILPAIAMMPLSARDAAEILKRLEGPAVPDEAWQGKALGNGAGATYRVGPGPARVHLAIENTRETRTITDVIATLRGTDEPARKVLLSNHYDAWVYGAADPSAGTSALLSLGRALGALARTGFRPRRTLVIAAWDAEEYTLTGSTEWGEDNAADLAENAVACINVDEAAHGTQFSPAATPLLFETIREVARDLPDPAGGRPDRSLADAWKESGAGGGISGYSSLAGARDALPVGVLGSGSDYTVFFNRLGIASADLTFDGPYGVYHSVYDTYRWMATQGDPGFRYTAAMARYAGVLALRLANADLLPFDGAAYGREIARYARGLAAQPEGAPLARELAGLAGRAEAWSAAAAAAQDALSAKLASTPTGDARADVGGANAWLLSLERSVCDPAGLPHRGWFRHLIYAPLPSYVAETLPGVREALLAGDQDLARAETERLGRRIDAASQAAHLLGGTSAPRIGGATSPPPRPTPPRR
ncbi:MAG TPA: M28 family metallopeptidase [Thermoanaerobaculia bacterium]